MKYNLGHSMEPKVLCLKHFKCLLPQAKASAVVRNLLLKKGSLLKKKMLIKKKRKKRGVDSVFTSSSQKKDKYRASEVL